MFWDANPLPVAVTTKILLFLGSGIQESKPFFATGIGVDASCVSPNFVGFSQLKTHWIPIALPIAMKNGAFEDVCPIENGDIPLLPYFTRG